ncbi:MAG: hypothetical protein ACP5T4_01360 [Candidatus Micrarchaeia archaeon]
MSNKGNSRHIKRLAASKYADIARKEAKYMIKPSPGRHTLSTSISLASLLRDKLGIASDTNEALSVIKKGSVEVNEKIAKDGKLPVGFGDIIHILPTDQYFAVSVNRQGAVSVEKASKETKRIAKIVKKFAAKKGKLMVRLHDGTILECPSGANVNDSAVLKAGKIESIIKLEPGAKCTIYKGKHTGEQGTIKQISKGTAQARATVEIESGTGTVKTLLDNIIVTGGV